MSDIKGFVVTLDQDVTPEWADKLAEFIRMFSHVAAVDPVPTDANDHMNRKLALLNAYAAVRDTFDRLMKD